MAFYLLVPLVAIVLFVQGRLFRYAAMRRLTYARSFPVRACFEGDRIEMIEEIENRKSIPVPWLRVESLLPTGLKFRSQTNLDISSGMLFQNHKSLFALMPHTKITRRHDVRAVRRGCYRLGSVTLTSGDLFGLARTMRQQDVGAELLVYPKPVPLDDMPDAFRSWQGEMVVRRWIVDDPFVVAGVRDYRPGDPLRGINWKATARTGDLQVQVRDFTADGRLMVYLNIEDHELMWNTVNEVERAERGIALVAGIAEYAARQGLAFGFGVNAHDIDGPRISIRMSPASGAGRVMEVYEALARLVLARTESFAELLEAEAGRLEDRTDILLLTAYRSDKLDRAAELLRSKGHAVTFLMLDEVLPKANDRKAGEGE
ncbi:hypothetical protein IJ21_18490 [Paenibacillus sp. 32O-W]|uniref:DUF58 domain-containing protein n=1 Tax=Paenibacillus sp. 32O-W TaxID=1695218 RepID=UPI00071FB850|nr:DUF58 domain-containing protein [Paenibacillus sp. 32O-W]ALS27250.1 hypothetical protein IJ21_18490 [Paenibacillus sp. 32O-W]